MLACMLVPAEEFWIRADLEGWWPESVLLLGCAAGLTTAPDLVDIFLSCSSETKWERTASRDATAALLEVTWKVRKVASARG